MLVLRRDGHIRSSICKVALLMSEKSWHSAAENTGRRVSSQYEDALMVLGIYECSRTQPQDMGIGEELHVKVEEQRNRTAANRRSMLSACKMNFGSCNT